MIIKKKMFIFYSDWEGKLTVYYTINGSPKSWKVNDELEPETWYQVEIKQIEQDGKVKSRDCFFLFLFEIF